MKADFWGLILKKKKTLYVSVKDALGKKVDPANTVDCSVFRSN